MKKKTKIVYKEDNGETIYSMSALYGRTPEEQEEYEKKLKNRIDVTRKERGAMMKAAFTVYGPLLLMVVGSFAIVALLMYLFLK
jgi:hypothetical protein